MQQFLVASLGNYEYLHSKLVLKHIHIPLFYLIYITTLNIEQI